MSSYAQNTSVSVEKSEAEIKEMLRRYGATSFISGYDQNRQMIGFVRSGFTVRFVLTMPARNEKRFTHTPSRGNVRSDGEAYAAWEQECRRGWRALALVIKAKLEAVSTGISTFEHEFMSHIVLPNGRTMGEEFIPQLQSMAKTGKPPLLALPAPGAA